MKRTYAGLSAGAVCALAVACGADGEMAAAVLDDAGRLLVDAGRAVADAGAAMVGAGDDLDGSVEAQPGRGSGGGETHELTCTDAYARTVEQGGTTTRTVQRVAELATNTDDITGVDVLVCSPEGDYAADSCPAGATCSGTWRLPTEGCMTGSANLYSGVLRVMCGSYFTEVNGTPQSQWPRWKTARVTIRR